MCGLRAIPTYLVSAPSLWKAREGEERPPSAGGGVVDEDVEQEMNRASAFRRRATKACLSAGAVTAAFGLSGPLAATAGAADNCRNAAVRAQQVATGLPAMPDCRAYEIVNPPTDDIGEINRVPNISDDGNIAAYMSVIPGDIAQGGAINSVTVARRGAGGWTSVGADPASNGSIFGVTGITGPRVFSPDFSKELLSTTLPASSDDTDNVTDFYRVDVGTGKSTLLTQGLEGFPGELFGATPNLDRIVFHHYGSPPGDGLYASDGTSIERLSIYPDGTDVPPAGAVMAGAAYQRGLGVGLGRDRDTAPWVERGGNHGASDDTQRVYFYDALSTAGAFLYMRDTSTNPKRTVSVSVSSRTGDVGAIHRAFFISASHNGSTAYFVSPDQLTDAATVGGGIYRFNLASETVTQITPDAGDPTGLHIDDLGAALASDDQSHIYFTSTSALDGAAVAGDTNAYVWRNGGGVRFIAKVDSSDKFVRSTPDGRYALLLGTASIGGAPNNGFQAIYRYDDVTGQTTCVSCRPDGAPSNGSADVEAQSLYLPGGPITHSRAMTLDGRVAFTSTDRILPSDQTSARDAYFYDKGTVSLLTAGRGDSDSFIGDVSDDGQNIFIISRSALVGADKDAAEFDIYDARVDGGFLEPLPPGDPCRGDDCQGTPTPTPGAAEPPSSRVSSNGDVSPAKVVKKLSLSKLSSAQRSALARTGRVSVSVKVTGAGTVSVRGRGKIAGVTKTLGSVSDTVLKKGESTMKLTFKLSSAARRELSRRHKLSVRLEARLSGLSKTVTSTVNLTRAR
jgi:hypothetical protein